MIWLGLWGIDLDPLKTIEELDLTKILSLDVAKVNDRYFSDILTAGSIPKAVKDTSIEDKSKLGKIAYVINGFKAHQDSELLKYEVNLDGESFKVQTSLLGVIVSGAMSTFGDFFKKINPSDGKLAIFYTKDQSVFDMILGFPEALGGLENETAHIGYKEFENASIKLLSEKEVGVTIDGDKGVDFRLKLRF